MGTLESNIQVFNLTAVMEALDLEGASEVWFYNAGPEDVRVYDSRQVDFFLIPETAAGPANLPFGPVKSSDGRLYIRAHNAAGPTTATLRIWVVR